MGAAIDITKISLNRDIVKRYYQEESIRRVMERFQDERSRGSLLVMATGSTSRAAISSISPSI